MLWSPDVLSIATVAEARSRHEPILRMAPLAKGSLAPARRVCCVQGLPASSGCRLVPLICCHAVIVNAPFLVADFDPPSLTTTSQAAPPGGVVAVLTGMSHVTLVGPGLTFVAWTGCAPVLVIGTPLMALRSVPLI